MCLLKTWLLLTAVSASGQIAVQESDARARLVDGKTTVSLAVISSARQPLDARLDLAWIGPADELHALNSRAIVISPGASVVDVPLPLSEKHDPLLDRLRYRLAPGLRNYTAFPAVAGVLDFAVIADHAFTLSVITAEQPRPGKPYEIRILTGHPVTGKPVGGVRVQCGEIAAVSDSSGVALLRVLPEPDEDYLEFPITATLGDFEQTGSAVQTTPRVGSLRIDTDKPLYQPGQTMHIRILETGGDGRDRADVEQQVRILSENGETAHAATLTTSRFGVSSTDWEIPPNVKSGRYQIEVETDQFEYPFSRWREVRHYELPSFRVTVKPDRPYYLRRQLAAIEVRADYLFGKPVGAGAVRIMEGDEDKPIAEGPIDASGRFRATIDAGNSPRAMSGSLTGTSQRS